MESLEESCRLCFNKPGTKDVTEYPDILKAIKHLYNIEIKATDKYTKSVCDNCIVKTNEAYFQVLAVIYGQKLFNMRIKMTESMNGLKVEPSIEAENSQHCENSNNKKSVSFAHTVSKIENDEDEDMDDQMTVVGDITPQDVEAVTEKETVETPPIPCPVRRRRSTMTAGQNMGQTSTPVSNAPIRKRRMSVIDHHNDSDIISNTSRTRSQAFNECTSPSPSPAKRPRSDSVLKESNVASKKSKKTSSSGIPYFKVPVSVPKHDKSSPALANTSKSSKQTNEKKSKTKHAKITQFFAQKSQTKCDKCDVVLKRPKEYEFHEHLHDRGRCIKCKKVIKSDDKAIIHQHMILCLYLSKDFNKERLSRFLTAKVCLDRLVPKKIEEIMKSLSAKADASSTQPSDHGQSNNAQKAAETRSLGGPTKELETNQSQTEQQSTSKVAEDIQELNETPKASGAEKSSAKRQKNKRRPSKTPKMTYDDTIKEQTPIGNQSAALNWTEETSKDKIFSIGTFENDTKFYTDIKIQNQSAAKNAIKNKIRWISNKINAYQQQTQIQDITARGPSMPLAAVSSPHNGHHSTSMVPNVPTVPNVQNVPSTPGTLNTAGFSSVATNIPPMHNVKTIAPNVPNGSSTPVARPSNSPTLLHLLNKPNRAPLRNRAKSVHLSAMEYNAAGRVVSRRQSLYSGDNESTMNGVGTNQAYATTNSPQWIHDSRMRQQFNQPPPYMTKIYGANLIELPRTQQRPQTQPIPQTRPTPQIQPIPQTHPIPQTRPSPQIQPIPQTQPIPQIAPISGSQKTLKVLSVDDVNSRAMNAVQRNQVNCNLQRNSPNLTENNTNLNNNIQVTNAKRPRTKTTPLRPQPQTVGDDENVTINVTLARLGEREAELTLSTKAQGRICYDNLSEKQKGEVQSSLLRNDTWLQMLQHLKTMRPTDETLVLFHKILPKNQHDYFVNELKTANQNRSG